jgi:hypothetical protein
VQDGVFLHTFAANKDIILEGRSIVKYHFSSKFFIPFSRHHAQLKTRQTILLFTTLFIIVFGAQTKAIEATCTSGSTTYIANYDTRQTAYGPLNYVTWLGYRTSSGATYKDDSPSWTLQYENITTGDSDNNLLGASAIYNNPVSSYANTRIQSPNKTCQIFLTSYEYPDATLQTQAYHAAPKWAFLGDSVMVHYTSAANGSTAINVRTTYAKQLFLSFNKETMLVARSGEAWANEYLRPDGTRTLLVWEAARNADGTPVINTGGNMFDEIRGAFATNPQATIIELGVNDAIRLNWTKSMSTTANYQYQQQSVINNIGTIVGEAQGKCLVFVTPPTANSYKDDAFWVGNVLKYFANSYSSIRIVDWATYSNQDPTYYLSDGVHPTANGYLVLMSLMANAANTCPSR